MSTVYYSEKHFEEFKNSLLNDTIICEYINQCYIRDEFQCIICHGTVYQPKECESCDSLFCRIHIEKWLKSSRKCPCCKTVQMISQPSRRLISILNSDIVNEGCPFKECNPLKDNKYETLVSHLKNECQVLRRLLQCPKCKENIVMENALNHYKLCQKFDCESCSLTFAGADYFHDHDCVVFLIKDRVHQNQKIQELQSTINKQQITIYDYSMKMDDLRCENENLKSKLQEYQQPIYEFHSLQDENEEMNDQSAQISERDNDNSYSPIYVPVDSQPLSYNGEEHSKMKSGRYKWGQVDQQESNNESHENYKEEDNDALVKSRQFQYNCSCCHHQQLT